MKRPYQMRKAQKDDLAALHEVFREARARIAALGIDQWQDGAPTDETILKDIERGLGNAFLQDGRVAGYAMFATKPEETYRQLDGKWEGAEEDSVVIHRVAVADETAGTGLGGGILREAERFCRERGRHFLRIDTHRGNAVMRGFLEHLGYETRGNVTYAHIKTGDPVRVCYEKKLKELPPGK